MTATPNAGQNGVSENTIQGDNVESEFSNIGNPGGLNITRDSFSNAILTIAGIPQAWRADRQAKQRALDAVIVEEIAGQEFATRFKHETHLPTILDLSELTNHTFHSTEDAKFMAGFLKRYPKVAANLVTVTSCKSLSPHIEKIIARALVGTETPNLLTINVVHNEEDVNPDFPSRLQGSPFLNQLGDRCKGNKKTLDLLMAKALENPDTLTSEEKAVIAERKLSITAYAAWNNMDEGLVSEILSHGKARQKPEVGSENSGWQQRTSDSGNISGESQSL